MRAMILAAGRGKRLRPLTDETPKPLLEVRGAPLIVHHIRRLADAGFREIVINTGHLADHFPRELGDGSRWQVRIHYSEEPPEALETGGGIFNALPRLGSAPFAVVNGDIYCDFDFTRLRAVKCDWAHLVFVPNPAHNPAGDFVLDGGRVRNEGPDMRTWSGIAVYHPRFFGDCSPGRWSVTPLLRRTVDERLVTGELFSGEWSDVGTPDRLGQL